MDAPRTSLFETTKFLWIGISLIVVLGGGQFFLWQYVSSVAGQLHSHRTNTEQSQVLSAKISEARRLLLLEQKKLSGLSAVFPSKEAVSQVVGRIEALADDKKLQLDIAGIEDGKPVEAGKEVFLTKVFSIHVVGPADALLAFFEGLEHQKELIEIHSWNIASDTPDPNTTVPTIPQFALTLKATYYFYDGSL